MDGLDYDHDIRSTSPDTALEELTWNNLGYRFGGILGGASDELKEEMYGLCVRQQRERRDL